MVKGDPSADAAQRSRAPATRTLQQGHAQIWPRPEGHSRFSLPLPTNFF